MIWTLARVPTTPSAPTFIRSQKMGYQKAGKDMQYLLILPMAEELRHGLKRDMKNHKTPIQKW